MKRKLILGACLLGLALSSCQNTNQPMEQTNEVKYSDTETIATILGRKSVRSYTSQPVEEKKVDLLLRAGMAAPSGMDRRPWELIVVTDRATLDTMASKLPYTRMLTQAPLAIVVCGDTTKTSYFELDCSAVTQNILLAAEALGLGAVWSASYPHELQMQVAREYLHLPDHIMPLSVIPVGYPDGDTPVKDKYDPARIHYNKW